MLCVMTLVSLKMDNSQNHSNVGQSEDGVADGIRTRNNKLHKLGLYR